MYDDDTDDDEDDEDDDDEDEDEDDEDDEDDDDEDDEDDEDEDENEDDDPLPAGNLLSGGTRGGSNLGLPGRGGGEGRGSVYFESFRVSNGPGACLFLAKARATSASRASLREK